MCVCCYAECHYCMCCLAECHHCVCDVRLNVIILCVAMLNVIIVCEINLNVVIVSVVMPNVVAPSLWPLLIIFLIKLAQMELSEKDIVLLSQLRSITLYTDITLSRL
jgi:hypothetical protein